MADEERGSVASPEPRGVPAVVGAMRAVADQARSILQELPRQEKFDLSSRQGWQAVLEAIGSKRLADQTSVRTLATLNMLCARWNRLYGQLQFEALTRPVWNT